MLRVAVIIAFLAMFLPSVANAEMDDYCSAPPYVTRTVAPNIMIVMDNSNDMWNAAYPATDPDDASKTYDKSKTYPGYFTPGGCYQYKSNSFIEQWKSGRTSDQTQAGDVSYTPSDTCPSSAPFRGNLLNWATTSRYDILQKILLGGKSDSRQANVNKVQSVHGSWTKEYNGCTFTLSSSDNLAISDTDASTNSCHLIDSTPTAIDVVWLEPSLTKKFLAWVSEGFEKVYVACIKAPKTFVAYVSGAFSGIVNGAKAFAASGSATYSLTASGSPLYYTKGGTITFTASASSGNPTFYWTWSYTNRPAWLSDPVISGNKHQYATFTINTPNPPASATDFKIHAYVAVSDGGTSVKDNDYSVHVQVQSPLQIVTGSLNAGNVGAAYSATMTGTGGVTPYTWSATGLPPGLSMDGAGNITGTPTTGGSYPVTITLTDTATANAHVSTVSVDLTLVISSNPDITTTTLAAGAEVDTAYSTTIEASGGTPGYTWSATGLPSFLSINSGTGVISGTPTTDGTYTFTVRVTDAAGKTDTAQYTLIVAKAGHGGGGGGGGSRKAQTFSVILDMYAEDLTNDVNGNLIWDAGDAFTDTNTSTFWEGKHGLVQKYWDERPGHTKARWGVTDFDSQMSYNQKVCIPATSRSSFYDAIQNAVGQKEIGSISDLLFSSINLYNQTGEYYDNNCKDDGDTVTCRKNFVLIISSGARVSPNKVGYFSGTCTGLPHGNSSAPMVQTACYGQKTAAKKVYTYIVDAMGTDETNSEIMEDAAKAGGGSYYPAKNPTQLEAQLKKAFTDILASAASGTAVSVLTTSSRGSGSMIQSYFLPSKEDDNREITWTGYTQNLWIDPQDNLREDTAHDQELNLLDDNVLKLYFDETTKETMAGTFKTLADGTGGGLSTCTVFETKPFSNVTYLWEAGNKLTEMSVSERKIFTSTNVIRTSGTTSVAALAAPTITDKTFDWDNVRNTPALLNALDADATYSTATPYTAEKIVDYILGSDLETTDINFRDRRLTIGGSKIVWKLGDVISSTPKVFGNTPLNTYHTNYGDSTYYSYITTTGRNGYTGKSSIALVGANDGMLHAFRVGYLKPGAGVLDNVIAIFQNFFDLDTAKDKLGKEVWGFIPYNAFPYLKYLANPAYCHLYYNDLSVRIVDVSIGDSSVNNTTFPAGTKTVSSWRTIAIGGMRFGGAPHGGTPAPPLADVGFSAYYAIDITDPEHPVPLWEFSDDDMGYSSSYPTVIRTGAKDKNGNWYVVIGSGSTTLPKTDTDINRQSTESGFLYILNLKTGQLVKKIELKNPSDNDNPIVGDILAIDGNNDYTSEAIYFGTSYQASGSWHGKVMALSIPSDYTTSTEPVADLCGAGTYRSFDNCAGALTTLFKDSYPFTASPDAAKDTDGNLWVYAGSGKYYSDQDERDDSSQIFLGFKHGGGITYPLSRAGTTSPLDNRSTTNVTGTVATFSKVCDYSKNDKMFKFQNYATSIDLTSAVVSASTVGWYYLLSAPERVISRPLVVGGVVDFLTYQPDSDPCAYGGSSMLYALGYTTGVAPSNVAIHSPDATAADPSHGDGVIVKPGVSLGPGAPPTGEAIIIPPPKEGQETLKKKIQVATGVIVETENEPVISVISKIVHWLKK